MDNTNTNTYANTNTNYISVLPILIHGALVLVFQTGLGSLAFRKSMTASLFSFGNSGGGGFDGPQDESIGSAGSLAHRSNDEEEEEEADADGDFGPQFMPVAIFLAGLGMQVHS